MALGFRTEEVQRMLQWGRSRAVSMARGPGPLALGRLERSISQGDPARIAASTPTSPWRQYQRRTPLVGSAHQENSAWQKPTKRSRPGRRLKRKSEAWFLLRRPALLAALGLAGWAPAGAAAFPPTLELSTLDGTNGFRLNGVAAGDQSGLAVSRAGDVNGDGTSSSGPPKPTPTAATPGRAMWSLAGTPPRPAPPRRASTSRTSMARTAVACTASRPVTARAAR